MGWCRCLSDKKFRETVESIFHCSSYKEETRTWDIGFVLQALCKHPFEPLGQVDLKFLTFKTLFLVAAASGRRVICLLALVVDEGHIRWNRDSVSIIPSPEFLAKNDSLNYMTNKITLPKMSIFSSMTYFFLYVP